MINENKTTNQTRKFFVYTRKSTDTEDQQVRSVGDQIAELKELAKKENLEIVNIIVEKQTAKNLVTPCLQKYSKKLKRAKQREF